MVRKLYISDCHFGHKNVITFDKRPFETVEEMDAYIIKQWNSVVSNQDDVYILGDFSWYGPKETEKINSNFFSIILSCKKEGIAEFLGIVIVTACTVNFKLDSHIHISISVKNRLWLVGIAVDIFPLVIDIAAVAIGIIGVIINIVGIIVVNKPSTVLASGIVIITAMTAENNIVVAFIITVPDSFTAAVTGAGV